MADHARFFQSDAFYRDLYKERVDFRQLGEEDADLARVLTNGQLDFHDAAAVRQLTVSLLRRDFGLRLELPPDRLCPPVPNRHGYILWLKALLDSTAEDPEGVPGAVQVLGLDVGTGASCIYPLLGCAQRRGWRFVATDIDAESLAAARANVERNGLADRIRVLERAPGDPLVPSGSFDFVMTNPPFYASAAEMQAATAAKDQPPAAVCTGAPVEMVYDAGGEVAFVGRLLAESAVLRGRVRWYTALLGKLSSVATLVADLRGRGIDNYAVAALVQGHRTRRWAVAWSYRAQRPSQAAARGGGSSSGAGGEAEVTKLRAWLPPVSAADVWRAPIAQLAGLADRLDAALRALELQWTWHRARLRGAGRARENVWSRAWRRKKQQQQQVEAEGKEPEYVFGFIVTIAVGVHDATVACRWSEGHSEVLFQSFCGFLKTQLKEGELKGRC